MGQHEVYQFLREHPDGWYSSREINDAINISIGSVTMSLKRLREKEEVNYRRVHRQGRKPYQYKFKE